MGTRGHSIQKRQSKAKSTGTRQRHDLDKKATAQTIIKTTNDLEHQLNRINVPLIDLEEFAEVDEVVAEPEAQEDIDAEDYDADDEIEYDETFLDDPFDAEDDDRIRRQIITMAVSYDAAGPELVVLRAPGVDPRKERTAPVVKALAERNLLYREIALYLAHHQKPFFEKPEMTNISSLNQQDLVRHMIQKGHRVAKEHVSRMLDSLYFAVGSSMGKIPAKTLFDRYGHKTGLSRRDLIELAGAFLAGLPDELTMLEKAKGFHKYVRAERGLTIELSESESEHDQYRHLKNILKAAEG